MYSIDLSGKVGLVAGIANKRSIAWAIAEVLNQGGAQLALTYQAEKLRPKLESLTESYDNPLLVEMDVLNDAQMGSAFQQIDERFGRLDFVVHSVAFAPPDELGGLFIDTTRDGFNTALDISAHSLISFAKHSMPLMEKAGGGSMIGLTYIASERAVPSYNVMGTAKAALEQIIRQLAYELGPKGVRVNGISAGPIATVSARGVGGFSEFTAAYEQKTPLRRNVTQEEVGKTALYLLSDLSSATTGEILFVDSGYHILGV